MYKEKVLEVLKREQAGTPDKNATKAMTKIQKQKRLSSEEFLKVHETLWKEGPKVKYQNPDTW